MAMHKRQRLVLLGAVVGVLLLVGINTIGHDDADDRKMACSSALITCHHAAREDPRSPVSVDFPTLREWR
jgi:hypothetical protein